MVERNNYQMETRIYIRWGTGILHHEVERQSRLKTQKALWFTGANLSGLELDQRCALLNSTLR